MSEASRAVRYIVRTNHPSRRDLIPRVLMAVGNREDYGIAWSWGDSLVDPALASIAAQATDEEFWILASAIWQPPKDTRTWLEGTAENLHRLTFARARLLGVQELQQGFRTFLAMHGTWAFGGARWQPSWPALPTAEVVTTWDDFVLRMLEVLFTSRSGEVLSSAINGMHAFVELAPESVVPLFQTLSQEWAQWWLLNAAESWATLHSDALEAVRDSLQQTMRAAHFEARMQAWIVLCKLADTQNRERPMFPMLDVELTKPTLSATRSGILETLPTIHGLRRSVDQHAAAKGKLQRMKSCGFDFSSLQPEIAERLLAQPGMSNPIATLKTAPHRDNDFLCSPLDVDHAVGEVIESVLSNEWCSQEDLPRLAQGLLDSEDPWLLRQTPFPSPKANEWPTDELDGSCKGTDTRKFIDRFRFLASNQERPEDWTVAAACVYASTWQEDFAFFTWLEERQKELRLIANSRRPTIPSGRTFNWWLGDHFEPVPPSELAVMGFFAGGMQRILDAAIEIQPSKLWLDFGWRPDSSNPLRWLQNGRCVAQYQRFHGKPKTSGHGHHHRQPLLHRWLVRTQEFLAGADALHLSFRIREDFERGKADCES